MKRNMVSFLMVLVVTAAVGCSQEEPEEAAEPVAEPPAAEPAAEATPTAAEPAAAVPSGGSGVCAKAAECCSAYLEAIKTTPAGASAGAQAEASCEAMRQAAQAGPAGESGCTQAIAGWRQGLTNLNVAVPAACAE